jgi:Zn-dependent M28 family amino/carboxypeptidase
MVPMGIVLTLGTGCSGAQTAREVQDAFVEADSARIMAELEVLAHDSLEGRRTGEPGSVMAQAFIQSSFEAAGLMSPPDGFLQPFPIVNRRDTTQMVTGANVVGYVPGSEPSLGAFVITGHYDHLGIRQPRPGSDAAARGDSIYNGADDNASGTVAVMSLARFFAEHQPRHTMVFVAFDAEEMGLRGARAFVEKGWPEAMALNVNLDMVARSDSILFVAGPYHYPNLKPILEKVEPNPPVLIRFGHDEPNVPGVQDWTGSSDHRPFHQLGIPFVYFGVEDHPDYHRASDEFDRIDPTFFLNSIRTILSSVVELDHSLDPAGS